MLIKRNRYDQGIWSDELGSGFRNELLIRIGSRRDDSITN